MITVVIVIVNIVNIIIIIVVIITDIILILILIDVIIIIVIIIIVIMYMLELTQSVQTLPETPAALGRGAEDGPAVYWLLVETGAHLALVWARLEQPTLLDDLAPVVYAGARQVVDGAGVGTSCLSRAGQTLLQEEGGGAEEQQSGHL